MGDQRRVSWGFLFFFSPPARCFEANYRDRRAKLPSFELSDRWTRPMPKHCLTGLNEFGIHSRTAAQAASTRLRRCSCDGC